MSIQIIILLLVAAMVYFSYTTFFRYSSNRLLFTILAGVATFMIAPLVLDQARAIAPATHHSDAI